MPGSDNDSERAAALAEFSRAALLERDPDAVCRRGAEMLQRLLPIVYAEMFAVSEGLNAVDLICDSDDVRLDVRIPIDADAICAEAVRQAKALTRPLTAGDYTVAPKAAERGARYGASAPLLHDGEASGAITVFGKAPLAADDVLLLQIVANLLAASRKRTAADQQLAAEQAQLQLMLEQVPATIFTIGRDTRYTSMTGAALPDLAVFRNEAAGETLPDAIRARGGNPEFAIRAIDAALRGENPPTYRNPFRGLILETTVRPLRDAAGSVIGAIGLSVDVTEQVKAEAQLLQTQQELRRLSTRVLSLQEDERRRIARELHDDLGQRLTALKFELANVRSLLADPTRAVMGISTALSMIDDAATALRRVSAALRPPSLDILGLGAALEQEVSAFRDRTGIATELHFPPDDPPIDTDRGTAIYRIVQEALTNIARHASARAAEVSVELEDGGILLRICDDGSGMPPEPPKTPTLGLIGMRERAFAFSGTFDVVRPAGGGTEVRVRIPLPRTQ